MTRQEIIESGLIELYAMNALSAAETAQVEAWAMQFPEIKAEIDAAQTALELYAQAHAIEPSADMKAKIMTAFNEDFGNKLPEKEANNKENNPKNDPLSTKNKKTVLGIDFSKSLPWLIAATTLMLAIIGFGRAKNMQNQLTNCQLESAQLGQKQQIIVDLQHKMDILRSPNTKTVDMKTAPNPLLPKDLRAIVYWNAKEKATLLSIINLTVPPKGKQYQLWAIVDGKPVDGGVFVYDVALVQPMKNFEKAEAFAVTLENVGGSVEPTMDEMRVFSSTL